DGEARAPRRDIARDERGDRVDDPDPLQHAHEAEMREAIDDALQKRRIGNAGDLPPPEEWIRIQQKSEENDERAAAQDRLRLLAREMRRDADDEEEEGKDEIGRRPPVPLGMFERRIDGAPASGIVDEQHAGDREPAERIEGNEALFGS